MTRNLSSGMQAEMDHSDTNSNSYPSSAIDNAVRASIFLSRIYPVTAFHLFFFWYTYCAANRLNLKFLLQIQNEDSDRVWPQALLRPIPRSVQKKTHVDDSVKGKKDLESSTAESQTTVLEVERVTEEEDFAVKVSS